MAKEQKKGNPWDLPVDDSEAAEIIKLMKNTQKIQKQPDPVPIYL